ncbi:MAG: hypothetical protein D6732_13690 [Methanobacteriota archaeon]|nr:MAG: hypothetical protein D6732_13690 [Euryarchaeota archaeon]
MERSHSAQMVMPCFQQLGYFTLLKNSIKFSGAVYSSRRIEQDDLGEGIALAMVVEMTSDGEGGKQ